VTTQQVKVRLNLFGVRLKFIRVSTFTIKVHLSFILVRLNSFRVRFEFL